MQSGYETGTVINANYNETNFQLNLNERKRLYNERGARINVMDRNKKR